jgi:hypothetical protein
MVERRRYPRYPCSVPVRVWLTANRSLSGRAVDVGRHGMCVVQSRLPSGQQVRLGEAYRVDVTPDPRAEVRCIATIRHQRGNVIGLETIEELPVERLSGRRRRDAP